MLSCFKSHFALSENDAYKLTASVCHKTDRTFTFFMLMYYCVNKFTYISLSSASTKYYD